MRVFAPLAFVVAISIAIGSLARAAGPSRVDVRGDDVAFFPYTNATVVTATGHALVRAGETVIVADAVQYDVGHGRLTAAGNVEVRRGATHTRGDAYALDFATMTASVLRVAPQPATYAIAANASEAERPATPDTFAHLDLDGQRPYIRSRHAIVVPGASVRMSPAEFPTGAGPAVGLPTFLYTLVQNQNLSQTAGPGASFDQPYNLFGSTNSLTAAHLRYETQNGLTAAIDNRIVDRDRAYVVTSFLPLRGRRADLLAFQQVRRGVQQTLRASHAYGASNINVLSYRLQATGRAETATLDTSLDGTSNSVELALSTLSHDVGHYFTYQLRGGYGYDHGLGGFPYPNAFRTFASAYVTSPSVTFFRTELGAQYNYALTSYDFPHEVTSGTLALTAGRDLAPSVRAYANVTFGQFNNRYRDDLTARAALGLPSSKYPLVVPDGTRYLGYFAYAGLTTTRTYQLTTTFRGRGENRVQLSLVHAHDFPQFDGFGRPPLTAAIDVTRRIAPTIRLEVGRAYTFGWAGRYLSPQYTFGISP